jgi:hypothetical protein
MKNGKGQIIVAIVVILLGITAGVWYIFGNPFKKSEENKVYNESKSDDNVVQEDEEKNVSASLGEAIFASIPKIYEEQSAPFSEEFKLNATMNKIASESEEPDFSETSVNKMVKKIFGEDESLDKNQLTQDKIENSIYYYSTELGSYTVLPVGLEGIYTDQILKEVTETDTSYFVYTYCLIGEYVYSDDGTYLNVVIGDKAGNDLVLKFVGEIDSNKWVEEDETKLPVFKYTLQKTDDGYYLTAVEQIN